MSYGRFSGQLMTKPEESTREIFIAYYNSYETAMYVRTFIAVPALSKQGEWDKK